MFTKLRLCMWQGFTVKKKQSVHNINLRVRDRK